MKEISERMTLSGIPVTVVRKNIRHIWLSVRSPGGEVRISAPHATELGTLTRLVEERAAWIAAHRVKCVSRALPPRRYEDGESVRYFGSLLPLRAVAAKTGGVTVSDDREVTVASRVDDPAKRGELLEEWYRRETERAVSRLLPPLTALTGLSPASVSVRRMRARWGTCHTKTKRIYLSLHLAKHPPECLEYVLLHELAHLRYPNHGKAFHAFLGSFMPDWKARQSLLRESARAAESDWVPSGEKKP